MPTIVSKKESIIDAACKNMQTQINGQMAAARNAGYSFPNFSNMWTIIKNSLPDIREIKRLWFEDQTSFEFDEMIYNVYMAFRGALNQVDPGFAYIEDDFFIFLNVRSIIKNNTYWIAAEWNKVGEEEEQPWSGPIVISPVTHEVFEDVPSFQATPTTPETPAVSMGPTTGPTTPITPGVPDIGTGEPPPYGDGWTFPEFEWPTFPQEEKKPNMAMIAAIGLGGIALILLLKK